MTSTASRFESRTAPCGRVQHGEEFVTEDLQGLATRDIRFACGCQTHREEFHDGSVHSLVVSHRGRVLEDVELRGE